MMSCPSSPLKIAAVVLLSFAAGAAAGRLIPERAAAPAEALTWESHDHTVRFTATSPGESYLVLESAGADDAGSLRPAGSVHFEPTLALRPPVTVFRLVPWSHCPRGAECNRCSGGIEADDCPPPPPGPWSHGIRFLLWSPVVQR